jgi:quercetin dioxygenase-like cupin family protein
LLLNYLYSIQAFISNSSIHKPAMTPAPSLSYTAKVPQASSRGLPHPNRFITTHNASGKAVFSDTVAEPIPFQQIPNDAIFSLCYATNQTPVTLSDDADVDIYSSEIPSIINYPFNSSSHSETKTTRAITHLMPTPDYLHNLPGVMIPGGTVLRLVDMPPGTTSPMHRTVSLDYGVVLDGSVQLVLDSGETRVMKRGDMSVQRGTIHAWKNMSQTEWARMLYILQEANPIEIQGKKLGEDYGGLQVTKSGH